MDANNRHSRGLWFRNPSMEEREISPRTCQNPYGGILIRRKLRHVGYIRYTRVTVEFIVVAASSLSTHRNDDPG